MAKKTVVQSPANTNSQLVSRKTPDSRKCSISVTGVRLLRGDRTARIQFDVDLWLAGMHLPGVATWHGDADLSEASFTRIDLWPAVEELRDHFQTQVIEELVALATRAVLGLTGEGADRQIVVPAPRERARRAARVARAVARAVA